MDTGVSALQLDPRYADEEAAAARINPGQVAPAPQQMAAAQPAPQPLGGAAPSPVSKPKAKYDPEQALEQHLLKLHPDLGPEHLDYAKNYMRARIQKDQFKKMGKENRAHATEYMVSLRDYDRALRSAEKDAQELSMLKKSYDLETEKAGGTPPKGLLHPKDDPSLQARYTKTKADVLAADARRKAAWHELQMHYKKTKGADLKDEHELSPMTIRMLMLGDDPNDDATEDMVDEHVRRR